MDCDGLRRGMDLELIKAVCGSVEVPVICSGGARGAEDIAAAASLGASAVAVGSLLHYRGAGVGELKSNLLELGVEVRE